MKIVIMHNDKSIELDASKGKTNDQVMEDIKSCVDSLIGKQDKKANVLQHKETFDLKLDSKEELAFMKKLLIGTENEKVTNPFSKVEVELCAEAVALYDFIAGCQFASNNLYLYVARDIFLNNWPKEYMALIESQIKSRI